MTSIRELLERHAYSGTAYYASGPIEVEQYTASCECGVEFELITADEEVAHERLLSQWSEHVVRELIEALSATLLASVAEDVLA